MFLEVPFAITGLVVGTIVGLTGVAGGALMTPILVMLFGVAPSTAVGTDLLYASTTKIFGTAVHQKHGTIDWQVVRRLAAGSLPAAALTLWWMRANGSVGVKDGAIIMAIGIALAITALGMIFKDQLHNFGAKLRVTDSERFKAMQPGLTVLAGSFLGVVVTMTSVGAGAIGTVMLVYLYPLRLVGGKLVGTGLAHAIPLTLIAGLGHLTLGNVNLPLMGNLLVGSIPGVLVGSYFSARAPVKVVQYAIAGTLMIVSFKMLTH